MNYLQVFSCVNNVNKLDKYIEKEKEMINPIWLVSIEILWCKKVTCLPKLYLF